MNLQNFSFLLTDQLLKGAAILALAGLTTLALRRASAAKQSAIWRTAFMALLLLPVTRLVAPQWAWHPDNRATVATPAPDLSQLAPTIVSPTTSIATSQTATPTRPLLPQFTGTEWLLMLWAGGAAFLLLRRAVGSWQWRRVLQHSKTAEEGPLLKTFQEVLSDEPVRRPVSLRVSSACPVPVTWGVQRPVILLPEEAEGWSASRCRIVLGHELAHIRRGDFAARTISSIVCALHWCNPLVWLAARQFRLMQEQACDDMVLRSGADAADYAEELVSSVRRFQLLPPAFREALAMAQPSTLETRVRAVINGSRDRSSAGRSLILASTVTVPLLLVGSALAQVAPAGRPASPAPGATAPAGSSPQDATANVLRTMEWRFPLLAAAKPEPAAKWVGPDRGQGAMKVLLERRGVRFPAGTSVQYSVDTGSLVVRNTRANLDRVTQILTNPAAQLSPAEQVASSAQQSTASHPSIAIQKKAQSIIIPRLEWREETTVKAAVDFLVRTAREVDPEKKGVQINIAPSSAKSGSAPGENLNERRITPVSLANIPLDRALTYITGLVSLNVEYNERGITIRQ